MKNDPPLVRQWLLIKILAARRQGATVGELTGEMRVSMKTIRRDLVALRNAGFPLEEQAGEYGRKSWSLDAQWPRTDLSFTFDEALALYLGQRFLEPLAGTLFWQSAQSALRKIRASLDARTLKYLDRMSGTFHRTLDGAGNYADKSEILDQLLIGIEDRKVTFITYQSQQATEPVTYDIYPYGVVWHRGSLYLVGHAPRHGEIRHWKVDRIESAEVSSFPFERPEGFDLAAHFEGSFAVFRGQAAVQVKVQFTRQVARYIQESRWHVSQRLTPQRDGGLLAEFNLSATEEIKSWILSFGRHAEVLEPQSLRDEINGELRALLDRYAAPPEPPQPAAGRSSRPNSHASRRRKTN
ncbi:MAG: WYL domain-containing protein [Pirellulaceae bacterium]|nr:WYL domain-containing protein [Pirellulaceae bacterium]